MVPNSRRPPHRRRLLAATAVAVAVAVAAITLTRTRRRALDHAAQELHARYGN